MDRKESYLNRLTALIEEIRADLAQLPEGPERRKMEELLREMERIAVKRLLNENGE